MSVVVVPFHELRPLHTRSGLTTVNHYRFATAAEDTVMMQLPNDIYALFSTAYLPYVTNKHWTTVKENHTGKLVVITFYNGVMQNLGAFLL